MRGSKASPANKGSSPQGSPTQTSAGISLPCFLEGSRAPDPASTLRAVRFCNLHHRSIRIQNGGFYITLYSTIPRHSIQVQIWGFYFLDPLVSGSWCCAKNAHGFSSPCESCESCRVLGSQPRQGVPNRQRPCVRQRYQGRIAPQGMLHYH